MKACVFFGCRTGNYDSYKPILESRIKWLIEEEGVTQFYSGGRGKFDFICSEVVNKLRKDYPSIKNTLVLSYLPQAKKEFVLPDSYTDSVYLLEKRVPPKYAIIETNKKMIEISDFVIVAIQKSFGGAKMAYEYAKKKGKIIMDIEK